MLKYALIQNGKIIKFRNVPDDDTILINKLVAHGYLVVEEQPIPVFDQITQHISDRYEIQTDKVMRTWEVHELAFDDAKKMKINIAKQRTLDNIGAAFEQSDQVTAINELVQAKDQYIADIEASKTNQDLRNIVI
jgi:predicted GNAT family acetyltransferase